MSYRILSRLFWLLNKLFMVPMFRLGLGIFMGTPLTSYIMVIKNTGRKSGKTRYTPVNYHIQDGCVYCIAGFGRISHWYYNLKADPNVELLLPGRTLACVAEEVADPGLASTIMRRLLKETGVIALLAGYNAFTIPEDRFRQKAGFMPVIRFRPTGVAAGPFDYGGWFWLLLLTLTVLIILFFFLK